MPRKGSKVAQLLEKSRNSATLAVETYNRPTRAFKSYAYIVLMNIAWTSLFHAMFEMYRVNYFVRDPKHPRRYIKVHGIALTPYPSSKSGRGEPSCS